MGGSTRRLSSITVSSPELPDRTAASTSGFGQELVQHVAEQLARRRESTGDEVARERARLRARQTHTVDLELDEPGHDIRARLRLVAVLLACVDLLVDVTREFGERVGEALAAFGAVPQRELALHQLLRQACEQVGVLRREAEQVHGDAVRQRHSEGGDEVDDTVALDCIVCGVEQRCRPPTG